MSIARREVKDCSARPFIQIDAELIKGLTNSEFKIYAQIKKRAAGNGECWESLPHMAAETGNSVSALRDAIKGLVRKGLIKKIVRPGQTDLYELTPPSEWNLATHVKSTHLPTSKSRTYPRGFHAPTHVDFTHKLDPIELDPINTPLYPPRGEGVCPEEPQGVEKGIAHPAGQGQLEILPAVTKKGKSTKRKSLAELAEDCPEPEQFEKFWTGYRKYCDENNAQQGDKIAAKAQWANQINAGADSQKILKGFQLFTEKVRSRYGIPHACRFLAGAPKNNHPTPYWLSELEDAETPASEVASTWEPDPRRNPLAKQLKELGLKAGFVVEFTDPGTWSATDITGQKIIYTFAETVVQEWLRTAEAIIARNSSWHQQRTHELLDEGLYLEGLPIAQVGEWVSTGEAIRQVAERRIRAGVKVLVFTDKTFEEAAYTLPLKDCPYYPELQQEASHAA